MESKLIIKAILGLIAMPLVLGGILFLAAGTLAYWQGWIFNGVFSLATVLNTCSIARHDPCLLARRMKSGPADESRPAQRIIICCILLLFISILVVSGIDYRLGWSRLNAFAVIAGNCLTALSFYIFDLVMRANSFASATIEICQGQKLVSSGPYGVVRHPMYFGALLLLLGMPLALGSIWALLLFIPSLTVLMWRISDEEEMLTQELAGYDEYRNKVPYRLIPWIY